MHRMSVCALAIGGAFALASASADPVSGAESAVQSSSDAAQELSVPVSSSSTALSSSSSAISSETASAVPVSLSSSVVSAPEKKSTPIAGYYVDGKFYPRQIEEKRPVREECVSRQPAVRDSQVAHFGIRAGIGKTTLIESSSDLDDFDDGLVWNAGVNATIPLSDFVLGLYTEAGVVSRVATRSSHQYNYSTSKTTARKDKISMLDLQIPIGLQMNIGPRFFLQTGFALEVPLYNKLKVSVDGEKILDEDLLDDDACQYLGWDFWFGAGVRAMKHFGLDFRFVAGLSDIYSDLYVDDSYWSLSPFEFQIAVSFFL